MRYNCRCTDRRGCGARKTLPHDPETWYIRVPKCPGCGRKTLRVDPSVYRQTKRRTCKCTGVHFPHRRGTVISDREFCLEADIDLVKHQLIEKGFLKPEEIAE